ncbi:MAG TPA: MATE family efflux transporter [Chthoniobacteraceae bacterium]
MGAREPLTASAGGALPSFGAECRETITLALPLISGQVSQMLISVVDTVMVGQLGVTELGAATLTNTVLAVPYVLSIGLLSSISVRVSQARGAGRPGDAADALRHGTWLALLFALGVMAMAVAGIPLLSRLGQPPEVVASTPTYLVIVAGSFIPAMLSMAWKNHADALNKPWPAFWILFSGVLLNMFLNWLWIYGRWGFPALGLEGAGWATLAARCATAVAMFVWMTRSTAVRLWMPSRWWTRTTTASFATLLAIGFPASLQLLTEVSAFACASLLIGTLGAVPLAAHQVAITCAATTFMVPLGVAMAITVRVGEIVGAHEYARLRRVLASGWLYALVFMALSMTVFLLCGEWIARQFVTDPGVVKIAAGLLIVAGFFQLVDGLQVVCAGALRGINDVRVPAWVALLAYWGLALPGGAYLGLSAGWGAAGVWIGLAGGLTVAAAALTVRAWRRFDTPFEATS